MSVSRYMCVVCHCLSLCMCVSLCVTLCVCVSLCVYMYAVLMIRVEICPDITLSSKNALTFPLIMFSIYHNNMSL